MKHGGSSRRIPSKVEDFETGAGHGHGGAPSGQQQTDFGKSPRLIIVERDDGLENGLAGILGSKLGLIFRHGVLPRYSEITVPLSFSPRVITG
jgi:hypothetical protein